MNTRYTMSVSPDFPPKDIPGWYIFNTWLQKLLGVAIHLELYDSFHAQRTAIRNGEIDLIYANPYDATVLVREQGFQAVVAPVGVSDETLIAVNENSRCRTVEDLHGKLRIACTDDPEVNLIGNILLEPADLDNQQISKTMVDSYVLVAKSLIQGNSDVGFFLKAAYDSFSSIIHDQLRVLISSDIQIIKHALLVGPPLAGKHSLIAEGMLAMPDNEKGKSTLQGMGIQAWEAVSEEDTEFMIDLLDTLQT
ncbi:MAG: phosphate/phosphite/phosphonate ABC transporter substrate-binding protein [Granulosicoccus sp.]